MTLPYPFATSDAKEVVASTYRNIVHLDDRLGFGRRIRVVELTGLQNDIVLLVDLLRVLINPSSSSFL